MTDTIQSEGQRKAQIVATIGPASSTKEIIKAMLEAGMDVARLNFSWGTYEQHAEYIRIIRECAKEVGKDVPIIQDLSGPRIQEAKGHEYNTAAVEVITAKDLKDLAFGLSQCVDYIALSFVGSAQDVLALKGHIKAAGASTPVIAKIERRVAVDAIDDILKVTDAVMIARGDLGNEVPLAEIPFIEKAILEKCKRAGKPVITATQMLLSMVSSETPTRAEVTDVAYAEVSGTDAVMLSEESANGTFPVQAVAMMESILKESAKHVDPSMSFNLLQICQSCIDPDTLLDAHHVEIAKQAHMGKLVLVRHHESEWNKQGKWTGTRDVHLTPYGFQKSAEMGKLIQDIHFDHAFASMQVRTIETLSSMLDGIVVPTEHAAALNERDYGDYTGKNKWDMEQLIGEDAFNKLRREWDYPVPNGETLKMVYERAVPFFLEHILPLLRQNKNVLVVSHGNTIRSLMKYIEQVPDDKVAHIAMLFGSIVIYDVDFDGHMVQKNERKVVSDVHA